ncbi:MAG: glycoside hydrolase family 76 protein [Oscillospiraceae bacterium]|nr:glycoside hydrolase family 76 protein [Oscillospiraceae bacterium]
MFNFLAYALRLPRALIVFMLSLTCTGLLQTAAPDRTYRMTDPAEKYQARAEILMQSTAANLFDKGSRMVHSNSYNWLWTAGCWGTSSFLTAYTKLAALDAKYYWDVQKSLDALRFYSRSDADGHFDGYTGTWAFFPGTAEGTLYYDDNMWILRDNIFLYQQTDKHKYLETAQAIADMLLREGWDDIPEEYFTAKFGTPPAGPVGGFYWNDDYNAMHVCSNGPAVQSLAMLSQIADNGRGAEYLSYAESAYRFLTYLEKPNGVFWDLMTFTKDEENRITGINRCEGQSYSYNSGTPISSAVELYKVTGDAAYLADASRWAAGADAFFAQESSVPGLKEYTDLPWFREILLMGFIDVYPYDNTVLPFIQHMEDSINYAYENHRLGGILGWNQNLMPTAWVGGFADSESMKSMTSLNQCPMSGIYASLAAFYAAL